MTIMLVRTEIINIATAFLYSAFNGLRVVKNDKKVLAGGRIKWFDNDDPLSSYGYNTVFLPKLISNHDLANAELLTSAMPNLDLTPRQAKLIYQRAYAKLSWTKLAKLHNMSWDGARAEYDEVAVKVFYALLKDRK